MLLIDLTELSNQINKLDNLIDEYEEIQLNIFNQLKDASINWNDGNSLIFNEKMYDDKKESELFLMYIKEKKELFNFIYTNYSQIGKKISCNLEKKNDVVSLINSCLFQTRAILNEFNQINTSFNYYEQDNILQQRQKIIDVDKIIKDIKYNIETTYTKIEKLEKVVQKKVQELEEIDVEEFDYKLI